MEEFCWLQEPTAVGLDGFDCSFPLTERWTGTLRCQLLDEEPYATRLCNRAGARFVLQRDLVQSGREFTGCLELACVAELWSYSDPVDGNCPLCHDFAVGHNLLSRPEPISKLLDCAESTCATRYLGRSEPDGCGGDKLLRWHWPLLSFLHRLCEGVCTGLHDPEEFKEVGGMAMVGKAVS